MTSTCKLFLNRKYNRVINRINGLRTLTLTRDGKKSCQSEPDLCNNHVKFNDSYPFIRVVFVSGNWVVSNFASSINKYDSKLASYQ